MKFTIVILLLFTKYSHCTNKFLIEKAAAAANSVFKDFITSVVWWHDEADSVSKFIKLFQGNVYVISLQENEEDNKTVQKFNRRKKFTQTVFFGAGSYEVNYFLTLLYPDLVTPIRLIAILTKPVAYSELSEIMKIAWKNDVADILIVSSNPRNANMSLLTTYFPHNDGKCNNFVPKPLKLKSRYLFPKKFTNYYRCQIRVTLLPMSPYSRLQFDNDTLVSISGIDGDILRIIFDKVNASMNVASAKDHGGLGTIINGNATGSFGDLVRKEADIQLPSLFMSALRYPYGQFCHCHATINIIWFGPRRRELSEWQRVLQPFMSTITPAILATAIVFVVVIKIIHRFELVKYYTNSEVLQTYGIFLGTNVRFLTESFQANILFTLWIWFCMIVRIVYQGDLVNGLQKTALEAPLRSFETAVGVVDGYGGIETVREFFNGTPYYDKFIVIPQKEVQVNLKAIDTGKRFLLATDKKMGLDSGPNLQVLHDSPLNQGPICFAMRPGWPAFPEINNVVLKIIESGILQKIMRQYSWEWEKRVTAEEDRKAKPLTLGNLIGCFYGLGIIYGVCTLILLLEILYFKINHVKH